MAVTQEDLIKARDDMIKRGVPENEATELINQYVQDYNVRHSGASAMEANVLGAGGGGTGEMGRQGALDAAGILLPIAGAGAGAGLGMKVAASPRVARVIENAPKMVRFGAERGVRLLPAVGEATGFAAGDVAGRAISGKPQDPKETAAGALTAGIVGPAMRGINRFVGEVGEVPAAATMEAGIPTAGVFPSVQKVMRPAPHTLGQARAGISIESRLQARTWQALERAEVKSPARIQKEGLIVKAEAAGKRVNPANVIAQLEKAANDLRGMGVAEGNINAAAKMDEYIKRLRMKAAENPDAMFSPSEWDTLIRKDLGEMAYTFAGNEKMTNVAAKFRKVRKIAADDFREQALPPEVRELDAQITDYLDNLDEAKFYFGPEKSGITRRLSTLLRMRPPVACRRGRMSEKLPRFWALAASTSARARPSTGFACRARRKASPRLSWIGGGASTAAARAGPPTMRQAASTGQRRSVTISSGTGRARSTADPRSSACRPFRTSGSESRSSSPATPRRGTGHSRRLPRPHFAALCGGFEVGRERLEMAGGLGAVG